MPGLPTQGGYQGTGEFAFCDHKLYNLRSGPFTYLPFTRSPESKKWTLERNGSGLWVDQTLQMDQTILANRMSSIAFEDTMENIATSLTGWSLERTNQTFNGTSYVTKVFVEVRWPWMIYPNFVGAGRGDVFWHLCCCKQEELLTSVEVVGFGTLLPWTGEARQR